MKESGDKIAVYIAGQEGERRELLDKGQPLLNALQSAGVDISSVCGGQMVCGACHVYIEAEHYVSELDPGEVDTLEESPHYSSTSSRLACQVIVDHNLSGKKIEIAPEA